MADSTFPLARLSVVTVIHCKPTATHCNRRKYAAIDFITGVMSCKTRHCLCNTLHYTATEGNTLQQTTHGRLGIFCNDSYLSLQHTATYCVPSIFPSRTATHHSKLQFTTDGGLEKFSCSITFVLQHLKPSHRTDTIHELIDHSHHRRFGIVALAWSLVYSTTGSTNSTYKSRIQ